MMDGSGLPASHIASSGAEDGEALVEVRGVSKAFSATQALAEVSLKLGHREILALLGRQIDPALVLTRASRGRAFLNCEGSCAFGKVNAAQAPYGARHDSFIGAQPKGESAM
jgi:hypothetical protein